MWLCHTTVISVAVECAIKMPILLFESGVCTFVLTFFYALKICLGDKPILIPYIAKCTQIRTSHEGGYQNYFPARHRVIIYTYRYHGIIMACTTKINPFVQFIYNTTFTSSAKGIYIRNVWVKHTWMANSEPSHRMFLLDAVTGHYTIRILWACKI